MNWEAEWKSILSLPAGAPQWMVAAVVILVLLAGVVVPAAGFVSYVDRKFGADLQARVGPNLTGPAGVFQPIADFLKALLKTDEENSGGTSFSESVWIFFSISILFSSLAFLPLASATLLVDTDMSAFLPFLVAFCFSLASAFFGLKRGTVSGFFGGLRVVVQACAGGFPSLVALLSAGLHFSGFRWSAVAAAQGFSPWEWTVFSNPFQVIAFLAFLGGGLVIFEIPPLDAGYAKADLQGGISSGLRGRRLILFRLSRFYGFFFWSLLSVVLFAGAWVLPKGLSEMLSPATRFLCESSWLTLKTFFLMALLIWSARVLPRVRGEQVTDFSWRVLSPFALVSLVGSAVWISWWKL